MKSLYKLHKNHTIPDLDSSCVIIKDINELLSNEHLKGNDNLQLSLSFYNLDALKPTFTISNDKTQENTYEIYKSPKFIIKKGRGFVSPYKNSHNIKSINLSLKNQIQKKEYTDEKKNIDKSVGQIYMKNLKKIYGLNKENKEKIAFKTKTQELGVYGQKKTYLFANVLSTLSKSHQKLPKIQDKIIRE